MISVTSLQNPFPAKRKWFTSFSARPGSPITPEDTQMLPLPILTALYPDVSLYGPAAITIKRLYDYLKSNLHDPQLYVKLDAYLQELQQHDWQAVRESLAATDPELAANLKYCAREFAEKLNDLGQPTRMATIGIMTTTAALSLHQTGEPNLNLPVSRSKVEQVVRLWAKHKANFNC